LVFESWGDYTKAFREIYLALNGGDPDSISWGDYSQALKAIYDAAKALAGASTGYYTKSETEPPDPEIGDLWFDTTEETVKVRVTV